MTLEAGMPEMRGPDDFQQQGRVETFRPEANVRSNGKTPQSRTGLRVIDPASWEGVHVPQRAWTICDMVPSNTVSIISGDGAAGKTTIALQLCVARALKRPWLGLITTPGRSLYLSAEDDADELHRRLDAIREHYGAEWAQLSDFRAIDLVGDDAALGAATRHGIIKSTRFYGLVEEQLRDFSASLLVIDAVADAFAGNENDRTQVRQFVNLLRRYGRDHGCTVLALAHPSLSGISSGSGTSGSTHWSNAARSRLYLASAKTKDDKEPDPNLRMLTVRKANYAAAGTTLKVRWQNGIYVCEGTGSLDKVAREGEADAKFLELMAHYEIEGRYVSPTPSATYAPAVFAKDPRAENLSKRSLEAAMNRLYASGRIRTGKHGRRSDPRKHIELAD
jgi:RecA-family ATPase